MPYTVGVPTRSAHSRSGHPPGGGHARRVGPRKKPQQDRSRETVEAIVEATTQLLVERGYRGATTERIARRAGVSVGSLYQYFPTKEAILAAVMERHVDEMLETITSRLAALTSADLAETARALVEASLAAHARHPALHRVLVEEVPRVGRLARVQEVEVAIMSLLKHYLQVQGEAEEIRSVEADVASLLLYRAIEAVTHTVVLERPELLREARLVDELTQLVVRYLQR